MEIPSSSLPRSSSEKRKLEHIQLALQEQIIKADTRFYYEPVFGHQDFSKMALSCTFLGKSFLAPLWVSSMTGGASMAKTINHRLAKTVAHFGLGMGLGSLRPLLTGKGSFEDFNIRPLLGPNQCLLGNMGIAQIDELLQTNSLDHLESIITDLQCDGIIVHINPLQEWYQPGGDLLKRPPLDILKEFLGEFSLPVLVKEVGQGMGPKSLKALLKLPIRAIELAAFGGTNFAHIERERSENKRPSDFVSIGHTADEMIGWINDNYNDDQIKCKDFIISGGIKSFLDGHYLMQKLKYPSIYGQASSFLKYALVSQQALDDYVETQIMGLQMAKSFLRARSLKGL